MMIRPNTESYIGKRVAATVIDYTVIFSLAIFYIFQVGHPNDEGGYTVNGWPALAPEIFWFCYFVLCENLLGGTLGHMIFKLKVVTIYGRRPTFGQTFLRRISDALEIVWCFGLIAFILVKNTKQNQRLGDLWAKTLVTGEKEPNDRITFDFEKVKAEDSTGIQ